MRLIDADKIKTGTLANISECVTSGRFSEAQKWQDILSYINTIPTAYDVDKVVEQIEKIMEDESIRFVQQSVNRAIKIVKNGGTDD